MDRDGKFSDAFRATLEPAGVEAMRLPPRSPNLSPHSKRFMRSVKEEFLGRMILFGEPALEAAEISFVEPLKLFSHDEKVENCAALSGLILLVPPNPGLTRASNG